MEQMVRIYKGRGANKAFQKEADKLSKEGWRVVAHSAGDVHHVLTPWLSTFQVSVTYQRSLSSEKRS